MPPSLVPVTTQGFENKILKDLEQFENITNVLGPIWNTLAQDPTIIIKEADKRGAIVIQNRKKYEVKVFRYAIQIWFTYAIRRSCN